LPPVDGATVRMYRTGHGDCFLLAFPGESPDDPVYVLIDCGYKPGSPSYINTKIAEITKSIREATGDGHIDVAVITHEHQDHVNGITASNFKDITIGETWLAWTEDPKDDVANKLRKVFDDKLLGLLAARNHLAALGDNRLAGSINDFLAFEIGGDDEVFNASAAAALLGAAGGAPGQSMNKVSMKLFKDRAQAGVRYIRPHEEILTLPGAMDIRVFALGPPRDPDQLEDLNPQGDEEFHSMALATASTGNYFAAAAKSQKAHGQSPFSSRYSLDQGTAFSDLTFGSFFTDYYGQTGTPMSFDPGSNPDEIIPNNAEWRRIDKEWLYSAERLALDMNDYTNNASLVLAFELGKGGKVLLFAADAQRGNWVSWAKRDWTDGDKKVTARDLLARTVLYKVGHHGSHNATLNGLANSEHPSLGWMAQGDYGREFTAMITAVRKWAETQKGWDHPLKAIKEALLKKASGRVFQTDINLDQMSMPADASAADWRAFQSRARGERLYFDCTVRRSS
ncbi:MAG: hypothetical protein ACJ76N_25615, partial [Thermoanaerobaculia bacterium]